jgi:hypothetical protein
MTVRRKIPMRPQDSSRRIKTAQFVKLLMLAVDTTKSPRERTWAKDLLISSHASVKEAGVLEGIDRAALENEELRASMLRYYREMG